jgi:hypothetical protein
MCEISDLAFEKGSSLMESGRYQGSLLIREQDRGFDMGCILRMIASVAGSRFENNKG